jgi:hypothetical protein
LGTKVFVKWSLVDFPQQSKKEEAWWLLIGEIKFDMVAEQDGDLDPIQLLVFKKCNVLANFIDGNGYTLTLLSSRVVISIMKHHSIHQATSSIY